MSEIFRKPGELKDCKNRGCSGESVSIFPLVAVTAAALLYSYITKDLRNQQQETKATAKATLSPREIEEVTSASHSHAPG